MFYATETAAADALLDAVEQLAEYGWDEEKIRAEFENAIDVAKAEGELS